MAWTDPRTWAVDDLVTADMLNEQIRDNLNTLKSPPSDNYELNEGSDYTTAQTSFVAVDATNLTLTLVTGGGDVMVHFHGNVEHGTPSSINFEVYVDGVALAGNDGVIRARPTATAAGGTVCVAFTRLITGLAAGTHTFALYWKTGAGTATLLAGAGTATARDVHPQFWAREVS